ncbi:hypothetical protein WISP_07749 [Willisornis vidua]|uniref:Uncharacterized protein n=1 Tax=Willisornis vidua TaxID=1566151 RepID=A0ABQ9DY29_9PASS|nr:hypothetical protein WISP_07749 [Willisornis vidua]
MTKGGCDLMECPHWCRVLSGPVDPLREKSMLEKVSCQGLRTRGGSAPQQPFPEGQHLMEETNTGAAHLADGKSLCWRSSGRIVSHGIDPTVEQRKSVRSLIPVEKGAAETTCDKMTITSVLYSLVLLGERRLIITNKKPVKEVGMGGRFF